MERGSLFLISQNTARPLGEGGVGEREKEGEREKKGEREKGEREKGEKKGDNQ